LQSKKKLAHLNKSHPNVMHGNALKLEKRALPLEVTVTAEQHHD
jgi:hypothetical protein